MSDGDLVVVSTKDLDTGFTVWCTVHLTDKSETVVALNGREGSYADEFGKYSVNLVEVVDKARSVLAQRK